MPKGDRDHRQRLAPSQRVDIIYQHIIHNVQIKSISDQHSIEKSTVSKVIRGYKETGRMYKLLPTHSKLFILKNREQCLESQRRYKQYRQQVKLKALQHDISKRVALSQQN